MKPRHVKQQAAPPSEDHDNDGSGSAEQSTGELHSQLLSKLASCANVHISLVHLLYRLLVAANIDY